MSAFAVLEWVVCIRQGLLSGCRDVVDYREFPREIGSFEGGSDNADGGGFAPSTALGGSREWLLRRGWTAGPGFSRRDCGEGSQEGVEGQLSGRS